MIKSIEQLRGMRGNYATYEDLVTRCCDIADEIEREVEERYIEGPTDKNGDPITYSTKIYQWGALEYIACEMYLDGTYEWFVRGHDTSAPLVKAKHVTVMKPPTVEDVLEDYRVKYYNLVTDIGCKNITNEEYVQGIKELESEFAEKLQLRNED